MINNTNTDTNKEDILDERLFQCYDNIGYEFYITKKKRNK